MLPIAVRAQGAWRSLTDDGKDEVPLKVTSEAAGLPRMGWTVIPFDAAIAPRPLRLDGPAIVDESSPCTDQEGFRTDAPNARPRRPTEFTAIATLGPVTVERVETVQHLPDAPSRRVGTLIVEMTQVLEAERVEAAGANRLMPSADQRAEVDVEIWNMWRYRHGGNDWYYFEAQKNYDSAETGNTFVTGWIAAAPSGSSASLMKVDVRVGLASDGVTAQSIALGVLRTGDRAVWIFDQQVYEGRHFELVETPPAQRLPACILRGC
jgi:hypothetical protein